MHFSKTFAQLLEDLPAELRDNAIQYRQESLSLKKIINAVVLELSNIGLDPQVLHELLDDDGQFGTPKLVYEFHEKEGLIVPQLRLSIGREEPSDVSCSASISSASQDSLSETLNAAPAPAVSAHTSLLWAVQRAKETAGVSHSVSPEVSMVAQNPSTQEVVITLVSDSAFFQSLLTELLSLSGHLESIHANFIGTLQDLSKKIGDTARPAHTTSRFKPYSVAAHAGTITVPSISNTSDLYSWREFFQLYAEAEVFESVHEVDRGERSIEESEKRLKAFAERVTGRGLGDRRKFKLSQSHEALETFLELNLSILNLKKFQHANSEATRKILKKHAKRTALPLPDDSLSLIFSSRPSSTSLPRILVQAIGEILLPIIPHIDDYSCLICTGVAFKPIRLQCGHLFCVRCLVKMQKRGQGDCPMCRAKTVLVADRSNVDWALLNFLQDWFPEETRAKLLQNEKEASEEQLRELGIDPNVKCLIM